MLTSTHDVISPMCNSCCRTEVGQGHDIKTALTSVVSIKHDRRQMEGCIAETMFSIRTSNILKLLLIETLLYYSPPTIGVMLGSRPFIGYITISEAFGIVTIFSIYCFAEDNERTMQGRATFVPDYSKHVFRDQYHPFLGRKVHDRANVQLRSTCRVQH